MSDNLTPIKQQLDCGADVIWALPTGGYGHVADEQPFPYIKFKGNDLTPRFGGDESIIESGYDSLPLPSGTISGKWPFKQTLFNIFRRRINIYWRNVFFSFNRYSPNFLFAQQLNYKKIENGFIGESPIVYFRREFKLKSSTVEVSDFIRFKRNISFFRFQHSTSPAAIHVSCEKTSQIEYNNTKSFQSSTGKFELDSVLCQNITFKKNDTLETSVSYKCK